MTDTKIPSSTPIAGTKNISSILSPPTTGQGGNNTAESSTDIPDSTAKDTIKKEVRVVKGLENIKNETDIPKKVEGRIVKNTPHKHQVDIKTETGIITVEVKTPIVVNTPVSIEIPPEDIATQSQDRYVILEIPLQTNIDAEKSVENTKATDKPPVPPPTLYEGEIVQAVFISTAPIAITEEETPVDVAPIKEPIKTSVKTTIDEVPKERTLPPAPIQSDIPNKETPNLDKNIQPNIVKNDIFPEATPAVLPQNNTSQPLNIQSQDIELARILHAGFHVELTHYRLTIPTKDRPEIPLKTNSTSTLINVSKATSEIVPPTLNNTAYLAQETSTGKIALPAQSSIVSQFIHDNIDIKQIVIEKITLPDALKPSNFSFAHINDAEKTSTASSSNKNTDIQTQNKKTSSKDVIAENYTVKNSLTGIVTGQTPSGFNIISVPEHHTPIILQTSSSVSVGTQITFSVTEPNQIATPNIISNPTDIPNNPLSSNLIENSAGILSSNTQLSPLANFNPLHSSNWSALENSLKVLTEQAPTIAQNLQNSLPTPNARLVPTALFFFAALKMGRIESWLGKKTMDTLQSIDRSGLADKIKSDFSNIARQAKEFLSGDWRSISMPMLQDDQNINNLQFFIRHQIDPDAQNENDDKKENQSKKTRFILNLTLSNMGEMQLDGLLKTSQLDIIIRTADGLDMDTKQQIRDKFQNGLEQTNLQGQITFQANKKNWITIDTTSQDTTNDILT